MNRNVSCNKLLTIAPIVFFLLVYVRLLMGCFGGAWSPDAALHLTQPLRYLQGDLPFVHEWHPSLIFGVLAVPFVSVSKALNGGLDGLMVATRICAATVWILGVFLLWWHWRRISEVGAILGSALFAVWPPWGGCAIAHNSFGLIFVSLGIAFCATCERHVWRDGISAGFFYALSVLCCPHLAVLYLVFSAYAVWKRRMLWSAVTVGGLVPAAAVTAWLLSKISIAKIVEMLPYVMNDPEHPPRSLFGLACDSVGRFFFITHDFAWGHAAIVVGYFVLVGIMLLDRDRVKRAVAYGCLLVALAALHLGYYCHQPMVSMNVQFMPLALMAGCFVLLTKDATAWKVFVWGWLPAAIYGACIGVSSNLGIYSIGFALEAAMIPSVIIFLAVMRNRRALQIAIVCFLVFHAVVLYRPTWQYLSHWNQMRKNVCAEGVMKGVAKGNGDGLKYEQLLADTEEMRTSDKVKTVVYLSHPHQWLYLASNKRNGSFSSWTCGVNDTAINRLEEYWKMNPEKFPEAIFVEAEHEEIGRKLAVAHNMRVEKKDSGNLILWK